jgi:hypothetical protein
MLRPGSSTRSDEQEQQGAALVDECRRLHLLIADLLRKNQELRLQLAQSQSANHFE